MKIYHRDVVGSLVHTAHVFFLPVVILAVLIATGYWGLAIPVLMIIIFFLSVLAFYIISERIEIDPRADMITMSRMFGLNRTGLVLSRIESIDKRQSIMDRLIGVGWITIITDDQVWFSFGPVRNPDRVIRDIREAIQQIRRPAGMV